jgi:hypothetical protein
MHSETGWLNICTIDVIRECGSVIVVVLAEDVICEDVFQFAFDLNIYQIPVDLKVFVFVNLNNFLSISICTNKC